MNATKREKSGDSENLRLSDQCQNYIDQMSDDDEEESSDDWSSSESEAGFSEVGEF